jgi:hypothetical protein
MNRKAEIFTVFSLAFILFFSLVKAQNCDYANIISWDFYPKEVDAGQEVTITARIGIEHAYLQACNVLVEASIVPKGVPYSVYPFFVRIEPSKCCPENENFDDKLIEVEQGIPAYEIVDVTLKLKAPNPMSYDHCADCSKEPERCKPGFYWNGEGYYDITLSTWNGCWKDLHENLKKFDGKLSSIYVRAPYNPSPICGNGICEYGENVINCFSDCYNSDISPKIPLKLSDILIIIGLIGGIIIIYKVVKK